MSNGEKTRLKTRRVAVAARYILRCFTVKLSKIWEIV